MRYLLKLAWYAAIIIWVLGFFGALHPLFDSLAIGQPIVGTIVAIGLFAYFWPRNREYAAIALLGYAFLVFYFTNAPEPIDGDADLRLYQHNLLFTNPNVDLPMVLDRLKPDVLTLQEIEKAKPVLGALEHYPHQLICPFATVGDVGVVSRHPIIAGECADGQYRGFAWARINKDGQEYTIVSLHLHWPFPFGQKGQVDETLAKFDKLPKPIFIVGDFNQVGWSHTLRRFEEAVGSKIVAGMRPTLTLTFRGNRLGPILPIDHMVVPPGEASIRRLNQYGSDHNALLLDWKSQ